MKGRFEKLSCMVMSDGRYKAGPADADNPFLLGLVEPTFFGKGVGGLKFFYSKGGTQGDVQSYASVKMSCAER